MKTKLWVLCLVLACCLVPTAQAKYPDSPYVILVKKEDSSKIVPAIKQAMKEEPYRLREEVCILDSCPDGKGVTFMSFRQNHCTFCWYPDKQVEFTMIEELEAIKVVLRLYQVADGAHFEFTYGPIFKKFMRRIQARVEAGLDLRTEIGPRRHTERLQIFKHYRATLCILWY